MQRRVPASCRTTLGVFLLAAALSAPLTGLALDSQHLTDLADLDTLVSARYDAMTNDAAIYPEGPFRFALNQGLLTFPDGGDISALTNVLNASTVFGVTVYPLSVVETQDASRIWLCIGTNGVPVHTNAVPGGFDPEAWVRLAYRHDPPEYLSGTNLTQWYGDRDRSRLYLTITLVNSNDWPTIQAAEEAAATNNPASGAPPPTLPPDTNNLAFAGIQMSQTNTVGLWIYTPSNRPVAILSRPTLTAITNAWAILGSLNAVSPFEFWQTTAQAETGFYLAGFNDLDSDSDGIPDFLEMYVFGTNPDNADSDGDGISDYDEIFIFGTDPWNNDNTMPTVLIITPAAGEWKAVMP
jgi:hypothetical protein